MWFEAVFGNSFYYSIILFILSLLLWRFLKECGKNRPPGPRGLPVVGYLPFLSELEHLDFCKLHKKYGKIFRLKIGMQSAVVLADFKAVKEAFNKEEVSERPPRIFELPSNVTHFAEQELREFKESRRFLLTSLRTLGMGKDKLAHVITEEIEGVLSTLRKSNLDGDINMRNVLYGAMSRIIISLICGKDLKEDTDLQTTIDLYSKSFFPYMRITAFLSFLPFMRPFVSLLFPRYKSLCKDILTLEDSMWKEIQIQERNTEEIRSQNYMGRFLSEMQKGSNERVFNRNILNGNSQVMLVAGFDTSLTTLEWVMMMMAKHPEIQERVYHEIVQVIGKERPPTWDEREQFPYLDAVLAECSRMKSIVPLGDPHWTTADTKISNYDVPKNTMVIGNAYAVHNDPDLWDRPERFNPDRFMTKDGKRAKDPEFLIPFSIGKRLCPGEKLARMEVFLFACSIFQHFKILPASCGIDEEAELAIVLRAKNPLVRVRPRE